MSSITGLATSLVRLRGVRVDHPGRTALHAMDLDVPPGQLTAIAGPNGAGKTTLLEVIAGTRIPTSGSRHAHRVAAFVPQRTSISDRLPVTVRDVVTVGTWGRVGRWRRLDAGARAAIDAALRQLDIAELAARPFHELSGGQRQRALLAQALAGRAELLLLDEPTTGLDHDSAAQILEVMCDQAERGVGVVCVSHDPTVQAAAHRIVRLEDGHLVPNLSGADP